MSAGTVLAEIFDVIWLLTMMGLVAWMAWLSTITTRILRRLEGSLVKTAEDSTHAITLLAQSLATLKVVSESPPPAPPPARARPVRPKAKPPASRAS